MPNALREQLQATLGIAYTLERELGGGGMSRVFVAREEALGRDVVVKVLAPEVAAGLSAERFAREIRVAARLQEPHIVPVLAAGTTTDGLPWYTMPFVRGESLRARLAAGRLPVGEAVTILHDIAKALAHAHRQGVVHRDVKPENVLLSDGTAMVTDFGIAKAVAAARGDGERPLGASGLATLTQAGVSLGTPAYMSPEQATGDPTDERSDLYAWGLLAYELLSGQHPFGERTNAQQMIAAHISRRADPAVLDALRIPSALRTLVVRCLEKEPAKRPRSADEVLSVLDAATAQSGPPEARRWSRATSAAALAAIGVGLWGLAALRGRSGEADARLEALRLTQLTTAEGIEQFPAFSPDGETVVFAGEVGGVRKLFLKRPGAAEPEAITKGDHDDIHPAWAPSGDRIYFVRSATPGERVIPGDRFAWYERGDVWSVDVRSGEERLVVRDAAYPSLSPDGRTLAVDAPWAGPRRIWLVDPAGLNPRQASDDASEAVRHIRPRWSPDGRRIVYQRSDGTLHDVAVLDVERRRSSMVAKDVHREVDPTWGADEGTIYYSSDVGGAMNVWRIEVDDEGRVRGAPQRLTSGAGQDVQVAVSPRGDRMVYATLQLNADLLRLPLTATGDVAGPAEPLAVSTREDSRGAISPDGREIAFNSDRAGTMTLWVQSLTDGRVRQVTTGAGGDFQPTWSPDGASLVFFSSRSGATNVWKVELGTGRLTNLTPSVSLAINPFFSPDGRRIVYQSDASGRMELWVMSADGSGSRQLTRTGVAAHYVRWLPDGFVYFHGLTGRELLRIPAAGGEVSVAAPAGAGGHLSFSRDGSRFMDNDHRSIRIVSRAGEIRKIFTLDDGGASIDYTTWSPDGRWVVFDRVRPAGGDLWIAELRAAR